MKLIFNSTQQVSTSFVNTQILGIFAQKATPAMMKSIFFRIAGVLIFAFLILGLVLPIIVFKIYFFFLNIEDFFPDATHGIYRLYDLSEFIANFYFDYNVFYNRNDWGFFWDVFAYKEIIQKIDPDFQPSGVPLENLKYKKNFLVVYFYVFFSFLTAVLYHIVLCFFPIFEGIQRYTQKVFFKGNVKNSKIFTGVFVLIFGFFLYFFLLESYSLLKENFFFNSLNRFFRNDFQSYFEAYMSNYTNVLSPMYKPRFESYIDKSFTFVTVFEQYLLTDMDGDLLGPNPDKPKPKPKSYENWLFQGKVILCVHYEYEFVRYKALQQLKAFIGDSIVNDFYYKPYSCEQIAQVSFENFVHPLEFQAFGSQQNLDIETLSNTISNYISILRETNTQNGIVPTFFEMAKSWHLKNIRSGVYRNPDFGDFQWFQINDRLFPRVVYFPNFATSPRIVIEAAGTDPAHPFIWFFKKIGVKADEMIAVNPDIPIQSRKRRWIDGHNFIKCAKPIIRYTMHLDYVTWSILCDASQLAASFPTSAFQIILDEPFDDPTPFDYLWAGARHFDYHTSFFYVEHELEMLTQDLRVVTDNVLHTISPENIEKKKPNYFFQKQVSTSLEDKALEDLKVRSHVFFYTSMFDSISWIERFFPHFLHPELGVIDMNYDFRNHKGLVWAIMQNFTHSGNLLDVGFSNHSVLIYRGEHNTSPDVEQYTNDLFLISFEFSNPIWMYLIYIFGYFDPLQVETVYLNRILLQKVRHAMHLKCGIYHLFMLWPDAAWGYTQKLWYRIFHKIHMIYFSHIWGDEWDHNILNISIYTDREHKENCAYYLGKP